MDGNFATASASGITSFPLFIEIKNNVDGLVTFSTTGAQNNTLTSSQDQQIEFILPDHQANQQLTIKEEQFYDDSATEQQDADDDEDETKFDVHEFLRYNNSNSSSGTTITTIQSQSQSSAITATALKTTTSTTSSLSSSGGQQNLYDEPEYKCESCMEIFDTKEIYDIHMSGHANNMKCAICNMVLKSLKNYEKHCLRCKPYECQICGRVVRFRPNFIKHLRVHTGQQSERHKYKCNVCQKEFMSFEYFKVHKKIHNENVNLTCDVCGKVFSALASLRGHMKLHTGVKLHKCEICGKGFGQRYNLKIHLRVHTGEVPFECQICKKKLHTKSSLANHMQTVHKIFINISNEELLEETEGGKSSSSISSSSSSSAAATSTKLDIGTIKNHILMPADKIKKEQETQTQMVVQKIATNKYFVIPAVTGGTTTSTMIFSDDLPQDIICDSLIIKKEEPLSPKTEGPVDNDTDIFQLDSTLSPKLNEIRKVDIKEEAQFDDGYGNDESGNHHINNDDRGGGNVDEDDDDDDDDDNILLGGNRSTKSCIISSSNSSKFQNPVLENVIISKTNTNNGGVDDDDDDDVNRDLMSSTNLSSASYTNIFETSAISNSIMTNDIYLDNEHHLVDSNLLVDLQSTTLPIVETGNGGGGLTTGTVVTTLPTTLTITSTGIVSGSNTSTITNPIISSTTDGNFIKKEWIFSNNANSYTSITKFHVDDDEDDDDDDDVSMNGFSESANFKIF